MRPYATRMKARFQLIYSVDSNWNEDNKSQYKCIVDNYNVMVGYVAQGCTKGRPKKSKKYDNSLKTKNAPCPLTLRFIHVRVTPS